MIKNEINFNKMIIQPLWSTVNNFLNNDLQICIQHIKENLQEWESLLEGEEKKAGKLKILLDILRNSSFI
jgi:hypothetical protein